MEDRDRQTDDNEGTVVADVGPGEEKDSGDGLEHTYGHNDRYSNSFRKKFRELQGPSHGAMAV